jgi:hypothetical protein
MTTLTLKAQQDHLERVASTRQPVKAISEFVWNALDADATEVAVEFQRNALGSVDAIAIRDNGTGITPEHARHDFENVGASWKRDSRRTKGQRAMHGKEGQGRLRFFSLSTTAKWTSVYEETSGRSSLTIKIDAGSLQNADVSKPQPTPHLATGTTVDLVNLKRSYDWLVSEEARAEFVAIFAPYVLEYPGVTIFYDGYLVNPNTVIDRARELPVGWISTSTRVIKDISFRVIEWKAKSDSNRRIHFGGESGVVLGSQPAGVIAPSFDFSAYAYSPFFQEMADANLLELEELGDPELKTVTDQLRELLADYFRERQAERSGELIDSLKAAGVYPYEGEPKDEVERRERQVFDIATHAVSSYSGEFKRADNPMRKITLSLLREAVRHNPDSVSNILHAVFNLPKARQDEFAGLLNRTELGSIIAASTLISDRIFALEVLKSMVFDPKHKRSVRERGELDVLVRDNTWLFGENFHITLSEAGLTKVMARVSEELALQRKGGRVKKADGSIGRVDSFLGRVVPHPDQDHREFLLLELKRPSIEVGRKQLDQLEDYVNAIKEQPDFIGTSTTWHFYLVTGEYDHAVKGRITQTGRATGLFLEQPNVKVWVKTWAEIIRECEGRLRFIQDRLQIQVSQEEIETRIAGLKSLMLRKGNDGASASGDIHDGASAEDEEMPSFQSEGESPETSEQVRP